LTLGDSVSKHMRLSLLTVKIWMKIDLYCQRQRCSLVTLVSANIRFVTIFEGVHWREGVKRRGVIKSMDFHGFWRYVFSSLRNETNVIVYCYLISCRLSTDPEIWPWLTLNGLNVHYTLQSEHVSGAENGAERAENCMSGSGAVSGCWKKSWERSGAGKIDRSNPLTPTLGWLSFIRCLHYIILLT